jgi:hypothetical protein
MAGAIVIWLACAVAPVVLAQQRGAGPPPPQAQPPAQTPPKGTGLIVGQVLDAGTSQPIGGALVTIAGRGAAPAPPVGGQPGGPLRLVTGPDGRFVVHDLPKGTFFINAAADGYVGGSAGQSRPGGSSQPVDLADDEHVTDVKVRLWRFAVLTGTVVDEAGEPAVNTPVRAFRKMAVAGRSRYTSTGFGTTDDRGIYRISALTPGDYIVAVPQTQSTVPAALLDSMMQSVASGTPARAALVDIMATGSAPVFGGTGVRIGDLLLSSPSGGSAPTSDGRVFAYQSVYYPAATSLSQASLVTLRSGEERSGIDLQLRLAPTVRLSGVVTAAMGPIGSVSVRLTPASSDDGSGDLGVDTATAATRVDGSFTFLGVPPGQFIATVVKTPRPPIPAELASNPMVQMAFGGAGGPTEALYGQTSVTVGDADVDGLSITLTMGAKVSGRFEFDGSAPQPQPQQLRSINVSLQSADGRGFAPSPFGSSGQTGVDANGQFKTPGYPAGKYFINVGNPGSAWMVRSIMADGRDIANEPLELRDTDIADVVVTFTDKISQLTGTVRATGAGTAPAGDTVFLFPADFKVRIANADGRRFRNAIVAKSGAYTFNSLPVGEYFVAVVDSEDVTENRDSPFFEALSRVATHVTIAEGEKKTQDLLPVKVAR